MAFMLMIDVLGFKLVVSFAILFSCKDIATSLNNIIGMITRKRALHNFHAGKLNLFWQLLCIHLTAYCSVEVGIN